MMWDTMHTAGLWAVLYYIALIAIGVYFLLNLVLSILLDRFARQSRMWEREARAESKSPLY